MRLAGADGTRASMARLLGGSGEGFGPTSLQGAVPPYAIPSVLIEGTAIDLPIRSGNLRGEEHSATCFFTESFLDEMARASGAEPLAFRMGMLGGNVRLARAVSTAAAIGGWDGGGQGSSMGLACLSAYGSHIGLLAVASVSPTQQVEVGRLVAAVDCGRVVNPGLVRQQIEGGLIAGLAQATARVPEFHYGMAVPGSPTLPRLARTPSIEVELLPSTDSPGGVSGLGFAVVGAAVGNALAAALGKRLRRLPLDPMSAA
jgi:isoquinoline 1-oxidoreductase beta subunit